MKELVLTRLLDSGSLPEGNGAFLDVETHEGPRQIRFTFDDAERLIAAIHGARRAVQSERGKSGKPPLSEPTRVPTKWETAVDPVNQTAVLRACFADETTQEARVPRHQIAALAAFLEGALERLEISGDLRQ
ncbi:MAG TPA: hypothetical protein VM140_14710 [Burkholderiales bacterium]|nr:hypothetical protein [Burkholderiales bacterium]